MRFFLCIALLAACDSDPRRVRMRLIAPSVDDPLAVVERYTFAAEHPRFGRVEETFEAGNTPFELPGIEPADGWVFELLGFAAGSPVAFGRSCLIDLPEDGDPPEPVIYFSMLRAFSRVGAMDSARILPALLPLSDRDVLVLGGEPARYLRERAGFESVAGDSMGLVQAEALAEGFLATDPDSVWLVDLDGRIVPISAPGVPRQDARLASLGDGRVSLVGGGEETALAPETWVFDPDRGRFDPGEARLSIPRKWHTASAVPPSSVVVAGGQDGADVALKSVEIVTASSASAGASLDQARHRHAAVVLDQGVLITGGYGADGVPIDGAEIYSLAGSEVLERMNEARAGHTATVIASGRFVLIAGGWGANGPVETAELYDVERKEFRATADMKVPRADHTALTLCDGTVLLVGGEGDGTGTAEIYNPDPGL